MKIYMIIVCFLMVFLCLSLNSADMKCDARVFSINIPENIDRFSVTPPMFVQSLDNGWKYIFLYVHSDPQQANYFAVALTRDIKNCTFYLEIYENLSSNISFDKMTDAEKREVASAVKLIDLDFAQAVYEKAINVLLNTCYGNTGGTSTSSRYFYLSSFSLETGYMSAIAQNYKKGELTGKIVELGGLLREYTLDKDKKNEPQIKRKIDSVLQSIK